MLGYDDDFEKMNIAGMTTVTILTMMMMIIKGRKLSSLLCIINKLGMFPKQFYAFGMLSHAIAAPSTNQMYG